MKGDQALRSIRWSDMDADEDTISSRTMFRDMTSIKGALHAIYVEDGSEISNEGYLDLGQVNGD